MRTFRLIGMTLLMVMLTVNFTACSDDDEIDKITSEDNTLQLLVGSWEYKDDESVETYQFNADYSYTYSYNSSWENQGETGTYRYYSDKHILTLVAEGDTNYYGALAIVEVSKDKLILACDGNAWEYTRKK